MAKKERKVKEKKPKKKKEKKKKADFYELKGEELGRRKKSCSKCGAGIFMAEHKDRLSCGKCGYTEWKQSAVKK